jgi:hypothetical protein
MRDSKHRVSFLYLFINEVNEMYFRIQQSLMLSGYLGLLFSVFGPWPIVTPHWVREASALFFGIIMISGVIMAVITEHRYERAQRKASRR